MVSWSYEGAGENVGLELTLWPEPDEYVSYIRNYYGIAMDIHHPEDYPEMKKPLYLQPGYDFRVYVTPSIVTSDKDVCVISEHIHFIHLNNWPILPGYTFATCTTEMFIEWWGMKLDHSYQAKEFFNMMI